MAATNARQSGRPGASWTRQETGAENIYSGVEVEGALIASVGNPTVWHERILISITYGSKSLTNNLNSTENNVCCLDFHLRYLSKAMATVTPCPNSSSLTWDSKVTFYSILYIEIIVTAVLGIVGI